MCNYYVGTGDTGTLEAIGTVLVNKRELQKVNCVEVAIVVC